MSRPRPCARRRARRLSTAALGASVAGLLAVLAPNVDAAPDPVANIPLGPLPSSCAAAPTGTSCETAAIARLDAARAKLGLGPYRLPAHFTRLLPARQLLVLSDLDRIAYALRPIRGLSVALDAIAKQGAQAREDPNPWPVLASLQGQQQIGFASNWAGGQPNALLAYYGWMYDDGYGSANRDCTSRSASGCWGHRHDILAFPAAVTLTMGAAVVPGESSYALTVVETSTPVWPYAYTWTEAMAQGAGGR
jgi:hypothetical protein